MSGKDTTIL